MTLLSRSAACMLASIALAAGARCAAGQAGYDVRANYTKQEVLVPMRDGVRLFTSIYAPKDTSQRYPILLVRTPYSVRPYGPDAYRSGLMPGKYAQDGFIFAFQDVRGCWMSEGEFEDVRPYNPHKHGPKDIDETTDTHDTIDWLLKSVPNNNGRVGMWGISYPGFYASMGALDSHPALRAVAPEAPVSEWFFGDDWHHNGAFFLADGFEFEGFFGVPRPQPTTEGAPGLTPPIEPDAYHFFLNLGALPEADNRYFHHQIKFWDQVMEHGTYDSFWQARSVPPHLKDVHTAVLVVGGLFDAEDMYGALHTYQALVHQDPQATSRIVMGPWVHGGWAGGTGSGLGDISFDAPTSVYFRDEVELPFFDYYLKDRGKMDLPNALIFETGANTWRSFDTWPPPVPQKSLYLEGANGLSFDPPAADGSDTYVSDPANPVPYTASATSRGRHVNTYMIEDQRFAEARPDVLHYETVSLGSDLSIAGPIRVDLFASTTGTDSDYVVKVIDVHPDEPGSPLSGYEELVRADIMRGKFRKSFSHPSAFVPGEVTEVPFTLQDVCHTFKKGHRIMVQVQSSWFPLVDRNPQQFEDIYTASSSDFKQATEQIYHTKQYPSHITFGVLPD